MRCTCTWPRQRRLSPRCVRCGARAARCLLAAQSGRRRVHLLEPIDRRLSDLRPLVDEPRNSLIKGVPRGAVIAMATATREHRGKPALLSLRTFGLPNAMTEMINSWKDQIPLFIAVAAVEQDNMGGDQFGISTIPKRSPSRSPSGLAGSHNGLDPGYCPPRRSCASTPPCGPIFLSLPTNVLREQAPRASGSFEVRHPDAKYPRQMPREGARDLSRPRIR